MVGTADSARMIIKLVFFRHEPNGQSVSRLCTRIVDRLSRFETGGQGVYHATGEGHCTWYELARRFLASMGVAHNLSPCTTADYPTPAHRPTNSILENGRLKAEGICLMVPWERDLERFVERHREHLLREAGGN